MRFWKKVLSSSSFCLYLCCPRVRPAFTLVKKEHAVYNAALYMQHFRLANVTAHKSKLATLSGSIKIV